jgi:predicted O-methyltransferase YrrM
VTVDRNATAILDLARATPGFLDESEGLVLAHLARAAADLGGPIVEIGAYLGRSTLFLAAGVADAARSCRIYSVDHHHGSEELQEGWPDHDPSLVDPETGRIDTLPRWRRAIERAGVESFVIGIVGDSAAVSREWATPVKLVFIDGGHGAAICWADYRGWAPRIVTGGVLAFHDVYPDPNDGGRPPFECYRDAIASGEFTELPDCAVGSLRALVRNGSNTAAVARPPARRSAARTTAAAE